MRKRGKKIAVWLVMIMVLTAFSGIRGSKSAQATSISTPQMNWYQTVKTVEAAAGETVNLQVQVYLTGSVYTPDFYLDAGTSTDNFGIDGEITFTPNYQGYPNFITSVTYVTIPLKISEGAPDGIYSVYLGLKGYYYADDGSGVSQQTPFDGKTSSAFKVKVTGGKKAASVIATPEEGGSAIKAGETASIKVSLKNEGQLKATGISLSVTGATDAGLIPQYGTAVSVGDLEGGKTTSKKMSFKASKFATTGLKTLSLVTTWKNSDGKEVTSSVPLYVEVSGTEADAGANLVITGASHSPSSPAAGQRMSVSFSVQNKGGTDVENLKITPSNLSADNFSPSEANPYVYVGTVGAGKSKKVTMSFLVSDTISEGLHTMDLALSYVDAAGNTHSDNANLFIRNVINELGSKTPKLIVSDYSTGVEDLKAGSTFDFQFEIENTHTSVAAKNIKITLSSENNVFSVVDGSDTFYIPQIRAGEKIKRNISLKVKYDCTTQSYPLKLSFEYEYEGMPSVENTVAPAITFDSILNLQVQENSRPVASNIVLGMYDAPMVNVDSSVSFDFYNMGKATLSNVTARVESDSLQQTGDMVVIGNIEPGNGDSYEVPVLPTMAGDITGNLIISYEDSNGETQEISTEFTGMVSEDMPMEEDPSMMEDPSMTDQKSSGFSWKKLVSIVAAVAVIGAVVFLVIKKAKKKKGKEEYEDD